MEADSNQPGENLISNLDIFDLLADKSLENSNKAKKFIQGHEDKEKILKGLNAFGNDPRNGTSNSLPPKDGCR